MITSPALAPTRPAWRVVWQEPQVPPPARIPWWDVATGVVVALVSVAEALLRAVPWPVWHVGLASVAAAAVVWRSRRPLLTLLVAFAAQTIAGVVPELAGEPYAVLNTTSVVLLLAYSLGRWASGRAVLIGAAALMVGHFVREPLYGSTGAQNAIGAAALLLPVALGATVRFWSAARMRALDQVRLRERTALARELHDVVAHHVSGIVVQAQAGQVVAAADPARAVAVLATVERAATQALGEMRALVGVLRDGTPAEHAPGHGVADLAALADPAASATSAGPRVEIRVPDHLEVPATVGQALYRVAQEAVANARWHATRATTIAVTVTVEPGVVRLEVADDGAPGRASSRGRGTGYGIVGMTERVEALGGTLHAGPHPGGWRVLATIPTGAPGD